MLFLGGIVSVASGSIGAILNKGLPVCMIFCYITGIAMFVERVLVCL